MYPTDPCPAAAQRPRAGAAPAPGKSRLCAFLSRCVGDGDGEGDSRSADLRGDDAAETDPAPPGLALDLDLSLLPGHHAGIAPPSPPPPRASAGSPGRVQPPSSSCRGEMEEE